MAKKEILTDFWVRDLLLEASIKLDAQGSNIKEIDKALKTTSKPGTGNVGFPEFIGVVKDYVIVIENKANVSYHIKRGCFYTCNLSPNLIYSWDIVKPQF